MDGLFLEPPLLSLVYLHGDRGRGSPFILILLSSVKHNPESCITASVGWSTESHYFLKAPALSWAWESSKVAADSLRESQEVIQQNE